MKNEKLKNSKQNFADFLSRYHGDGWRNKAQNLSKATMSVGWMIRRREKTKKLSRKRKTSFLARA
jgi:hypothetical protein